MLSVVERGSRAGAAAKEALIEAATALGGLEASAGLRTLKVVLGLEKP